MIWSDLLAAFALYLVIEGLLPFASPKSWRRSLLVVARLTDSQLRIFGAAAVLVGVLILLAVRG
jgi:uncharacterized protein YjeT (DUF2065 family)